MAIRLEFGAEPIPGYRLVERLGGGGFGEVWKAEAPGGLYKAIKFVYGDLQSTDDGSRAEQELKALSRVKTVHHPFILSLERYDIINGQLMIVMELADRTIWDRFKECRQEGMPGIPREELLGYLRETAEALDLMNMQFQLQHLDIKPQNLFLVFNHIKVADFGLVKDLGTMAAATITGGVTPVYAAPETFDGWLSRFSGQYSLAIVYQELLTGIRPFQGATMRQLVMQHLQSPPNVTPLPAGDRAPVTKALSKNPDERFPTCIDFIKSLYYTVPTPSATSTARGAPAPAKSEPAPALPARPTGAVTSPDVPPAPAPEPPKSVPKPAPNEPKLEDKPDRPASEVDVTWKARRERGLAGSSAMIHLPEISFQPPPGSSASVEVILRTDGELKLPARPRGKAASASKLDLADPNASRGVIQPAVVLGLGQLGMDTLLQFRRIVAAEFGQFEAAPHLRLLGLDTDPDTIREFGGADASVSLRPSEMLCLRLQRVNQYLAKIRGDGKLPTEQWLSTKVLYRITKENAKAAARPLGRFALVNHIATVSKRIESEIQACVSGDTLTELAALKDLGTRSPRPRVYVVANLAGASGGGMFIDAAYLARKHLRALGHRDSEVVGVFYVPSTSDEGIRGLSLANAYAALSELRHFNEQGGMKALYGSFQSKETIKLDEAGPPFDRCVFLPLPKGRFEPGTTPEVVRLAAQTLFRDLATSMGRMMDRVREHALEVANEPVTLESIGLRTLRYPRADLVRSVASRFAGRLVDRWKSKDASSLRDSIGAWARETWDTLGLRPEALIDRYLELAAKSFKKPVEKVLQETIQPALAALAPTEGKVNVTPTVSALDKLEQLLGIPEANRDGMNRNMEPSTIEKLLLDVGERVVDECDARLAELVVSIVEDPNFRLAGAEEALRRLNAVAEESLKVQENLVKELNERSGALLKRIQELLGDREKNVERTPASRSSLWGMRKAEAGTTANLAELLRVYPKTHFQSLIVAGVSKLYVCLRGHLSDQLREVGFCRTRLDELAGLVRTSDQPSAQRCPESDRLLLPAGFAAFDDVVTGAVADLSPEDLFAFDTRMQETIRKQYHALLSVCLGPSAAVRALAPVLLAEAEAFVSEKIPSPGLLELLAHREGHDPDVAASIREAYDAALPAIRRKGSNEEVAIVSVPTGDVGDAIKATAAETIPHAALVQADRPTEIVLYRAFRLGGLGDLAAFDAIAQEAYRQRLSQDPIGVHTREDVADWDAIPVAAQP